MTKKYFIEAPPFVVRDHIPVAPAPVPPASGLSDERLAEAIRLIAELLAVEEWTNAQADSVRRRAEAWLLGVPLLSRVPEERTRT